MAEASDGEAASTVYRSREQMWSMVGTGAFLSVWMLGLCVEGIQADKAAPVLAIVLSVWMPMLFLIWRLGCSTVRADQAGVHVRNVFTSFDLRWDEIKSFDIGSDGYLPGMLIITLVDGETRRACGVGKPNPATRPNNRTAELIAHALNERLRQSVPLR